MTPVRRLEGRSVTTLEGLADGLRTRWAEALLATGGSQCGFCTPGIVMRLAALGRAAGGSPGAAGAVERALLAHLCRCTGWQTIAEAARAVLVAKEPGAPEGQPGPARDLGAAAERATLEGGAPQRVGTDVVLGRAGFADDTAPTRAVVAVPDGNGDFAVASTPGAARRRAGRVQGRSTPAPLVHPVAVPAGDWARILQTTWVEPGYVETDASWCDPGGAPASACANGGAFGAKRRSAVEVEAERLAAERGEPVRVLWSREDTVRRGAKRPPVAGGVRDDGGGILRVGITPGSVDDADWAALADRVAVVAPGLVLEAVPVVGPPIGLDLRAAVWAEAAALAGAARLGRGDGEPVTGVPVEVKGPSGGSAVATCREDGSIAILVDAGPPGDSVVLRSYCIGATHQALGLVRSEGLAVDGDGDVHDLTVRSFGIIQARAMPAVEVSIEQTRPRPVNGSDAVFAAVAAARWLADGLSPRWPTDRGGGGRR